VDLSSFGRSAALARTRAAALPRHGTLCGFTALCIAGSACATAPPAPAGSPEIETTLFLIGDAGAPDPRVVGAPLDSIRAQAAAAPERSIIVFLGDNVYPGGIPDEGRAEYMDALRRLDAQILSVPAGARGIFIPGNHDWGNEGPDGLYSIRWQGALIAGRARGRDVVMLPRDGCPGPVSVDAGRLRLVLLDTQWWLHEYIVRDSASACATGLPGGVTDSLRRALVPDRPGFVAVVAGHHPLITGGEHGGYCGFAGPYRRLGPRPQDILSRANRAMRDSIEAAFEPNPPLVYAAGHEHNLQVLGGRNARYLLVSGAGAYEKRSCVVWLRESVFVAQSRTGFMRLDVIRGGGVRLQVHVYDRAGRGGVAYTRWLERP